MAFLKVPEESRLFKRGGDGRFRIQATEDAYQDWKLNPHKKWMDHADVEALHVFYDERSCYINYKAKKRPWYPTQSCTVR